MSGAIHRVISKSVPSVSKRLFCKRLNTGNTTPVRSAGHSHWDNIRHIKGAKDAQKSSIGQQVAMKIRIALREPGGSNIKSNKSLAKVVQFAEQNNVPLKSVESMIAKAVASKAQSSASTKIEVSGPSGTSIILDITTSQLGKANKELTKLLGKYGCSILNPGGASSKFIEKGIITAVPKEVAIVNLSEAEEIAILVEAEDVRLLENTDADDQISYELKCDPESLYTVVKRLADTNLEVVDYNITPVPLVTIALTDDNKELINSAMQSIQNLSDCTINDIYDNIQW